jgi:hypothetical protein
MKFQLSVISWRSANRQDRVNVAPGKTFCSTRLYSWPHPALQDLRSASASADSFICRQELAILLGRRTVSSVQIALLFRLGGPDVFQFCKVVSGARFRHIGARHLWWLSSGCRHSGRTQCCCGTGLSYHMPIWSGLQSDRPSYIYLFVVLLTTPSAAQTLASNCRGDM